MKQNTKLKKAAVKNITIKRNGEVIKEGNPSEHSVRHGVPLQTRSVGISKGITRNMGDFESLRVDVWVTDEVQPDETLEDALNRIEPVVDEALEDAVYSMIDK